MIVSLKNKGSYLGPEISRKNTVACTCQAILHMTPEASQSDSTHPQCQDGKLTGERNGSHSLDSAWHEGYNALFATGDCYHKTIYQLGRWLNQAYSRLSTTHGHITDCKLDSVVYAGVCVVI